MHIVNYLPWNKINLADLQDEQLNPRFHELRLSFYYILAAQV